MLHVPSHVGGSRQAQGAKARPKPRPGGVGAPVQLIRPLLEALHPGRPVLLLRLELEEALLRIDRLDSARQDDPPSVQEGRAQHKRTRAAVDRIDDDAVHDTDTRAAGTDREALGVAEPVLEHVATTSEDVSRHGLPFTAPTRAPKPP